MQQVADWLEKLGMSEYRERFAENRIDFSVLPELTDQDLKDVGILLGDRRKILRAIAALTSVPAAHPTPAVPPAASASYSAAKQSPADGPPPASASFTPANAAGERRYLTVMFCDLVGSTAISAQLDARGVARPGRRLSRRPLPLPSPKWAVTSPKNSAMV
jgi:hypothetical protein